MATEYDQNSPRKAAAVAQHLRDLYGDQEISEMRLELLLFLADWFHCFAHKVSLTGLRWEITAGMQVKIKNPERCCLSRDHSDHQLDEKGRKIVAFVVEKTKSMLFNAVVGTVYNTYPLTKPTIYVDLDLEDDAIKYHGRDQNHNRTEGRSFP